MCSYLINAIIENDVNKVEELLKRGMNPNFIDYSLIKDCNSAENTIVYIDINKFRYDIPKYIIENNIFYIDCGVYCFSIFYPLKLSVMSKNHTNITKLLLEYKAEVNHNLESFNYKEIYGEYYLKCLFMKENRWCETPLSYAYRNGNLEAAHLLIENNAIVEEDTLIKNLALFDNKDTITNINIMKIYVLAGGEIGGRWICDVLKREWDQNHSLLKKLQDKSQDKTQDDYLVSTQNPNEADIIWLLAGWAWKRIPLQLLKSKKVITTIHHIVPDKFNQSRQQNFKARDQITDLYHTACQKTTEFIKKFITKHGLRARVINTRIELLKLNKYNYIICRALTPLEGILNYSLLFSNNKTTLVLLKGKNVKKEIIEARKKFSFKYTLNKSKSSGGGFVLTIKSFSKK